MSDPSLLLAVDASTTSLRVVIFDVAGNVVSAGRAPLSIESPEPHAYEQDAESWWNALVLAVRAALAPLGEDRRKSVLALSIAHQRETVVVTDARGVPLHPAILWMDGRAEEDVKTAERMIGGVRLHALSGKPACTTPSLYKLMFLLRRRPELLDVAHVHDVHSFLSLRLTGRSVSSFASADPMGLVDMRQKRWSEALLGLIGVEPHQLPELVEVGYMIGTLTQSAASALGLPEHTFVYAGAGDAQAAGLGSGVYKRGPAFLDLGTAVTCSTLIDGYQIDHAYRTLHAAVPGRYSLETTIRGGMQTLYWLAEQVDRNAPRRQTLAALEAHAAEIPPGSDGLLCVPYFAGAMNPYWNDRAGGLFMGLHTEHGPGHLYRAILEGIACEQRLHLEGVESSIGRTTEGVVVLGGGSRSDVWCRIFANVLGRRIVRARCGEAGALGAAMIAAVSHGIYESYEIAASEMTRYGTEFLPSESRADYERLYRECYRGLFRDVETKMTALAGFRRSGGRAHQSTPPGAPEDDENDSGHHS